MTLNEAILENLNQQIYLMCKILKSDLDFLETIDNPTDLEKLRITTIKEKLEEVDKLNSHD